MNPIPTYAATLSGKSTLLEETLAVLRELDRGRSIAEVKAMVMDGDLLGKPTRSTRKSVWDHLHARYLSDDGRAATLARMVTCSLKKKRDGILPVTRAAGELSALEAEFGEAAAFKMESDIGQVLGQPLVDWLAGPFVK